MNKLGAIYLTHPERIVIGQLSYNEKQNNALVGFDLAALLPVCRSTQLEELCAYCLPGVEFDAPYLLGDIQICLKTKRIKVGWIKTDDDAKGSVIYSVRLNVEVVLKRFDCVFLHFHSTNVKEDE